MPVIADWISPTKPQFKRDVKDSTVSQRCLTDSASLSLSTTLTRLSRWASKGIKNVAANSCGKRRRGFQQASIKKICPSTLPTRSVSDRSREAYKYVLYPCNCSTIYSLDSAKSSRLVSDALNKFSPLIEYWNLYRTDIYSIHRGPANQTVPVL